MSDLLALEHVGALLAVALATAVLVWAARRRPGRWLRVFALVLLADELSWWVYLAAGGGEPGQRAQPLPLQLCDVAILIACAARSHSGVTPKRRKRERRRANQR